MQQVMHLFFYTKKKFQMKIKNNYEPNLLTYKQKNANLYYKQNKNKLRTKHSERRYHEQHRTFR